MPVQIVRTVICECDIMEYKTVNHISNPQSDPTETVAAVTRAALVLQERK